MAKNPPQPPPKFQQEGEEGSDFHRVKLYCFNSALEPGKRLQEYMLPSLIISQSSLLPADETAALGVHAESFIPKGTLVAMYGGAIIPQNYGEHLFRAGQGGWVKTVGFNKFLGHSLDGSVTVDLPLSYYVDNCLVGSLINDHHGTGKDTNVEEITVTGIDFVHPYAEWAHIDAVQVYRTTRDLQPGEEVLTKYSSLYRRIYYEKDKSLNERYRARKPPMSAKDKTWLQQFKELG